MTKEQFERANELSMALDFTQNAIAGLRLAKESQKENTRIVIICENGNLQLFIKGKKHYSMYNSALEVVLDTLVEFHEKKLNQIEKEFNEL